MTQSIVPCTSHFFIEIALGREPSATLDPAGHNRLRKPVSTINARSQSSALDRPQRVDSARSTASGRLDPLVAAQSIVLTAVFAAALSKDTAGGHGRAVVDALRQLQRRPRRRPGSEPLLAQIPEAAATAEEEHKRAGAVLRGLAGRTVFQYKAHKGVDVLAAKLVADAEPQRNAVFADGTALEADRSAVAGVRRQRKLDRGSAT